MNHPGRWPRALAALVVVLLATPATAAPPPAVSYQGLLLDAVGAPIDGDVNIEVRVWSDPASISTTALLYEEVHLNTPVIAGVFEIILGRGAFASDPPFDSETFSNGETWLELTVEGETLAPRQQFLSAPFSLRAEHARDAETVGGIPASNLLPRGKSLQCRGGERVFAIDRDTGDVVCGAVAVEDTNAARLCQPGQYLNGSGACDAGFLDADGVDAYNSFYDTEAEIDAAVANNGYSIGAHTVDTNAATVCGNGAFLNGDGSCDATDGSGDCTAGRVCTGGHLHSVYNDATNLSLGTLSTDRYDAYDDLSVSGRLDAIGEDDLLTRAQIEERFVPASVVGDAYTPRDYTHDEKTGYLHVSGASLVPDDKTFTYTKSIGFVAPTLTPTFSGSSSIDLPDRAVIRGVTGHYFDDSTADVETTYTCVVRRRSWGGQLSQIVASQSTTINWAPATAVRLIESERVAEVVVKSGRVYEVWASVSSPEPSTDLRHYGCTVEYTYTNANN